MGGSAEWSSRARWPARPRLLLLDEPAAGLNDDETRGLVEIVRSLRDDGLTILLIEHDMKVVMGTAEVVTVLDYGRLLLTGSPSDVATDAQGDRSVPGRGTGRMILEVTGLHCHYGPVHAVKGMDFAVG